MTYAAATNGVVIMLEMVPSTPAMTMYAVLVVSRVEKITAMSTRLSENDTTPASSAATSASPKVGHQRGFTSRNERRIASVPGSPSTSSTGVATSQDTPSHTPGTMQHTKPTMIPP